MLQKEKMSIFSGIPNRVEENFRFFLTHVLSGAFICLMILMIARLFLVISFVSDEYVLISLTEKLNFWFLSLRFDLKVLMLGYSLAILTALCTFWNDFFGIFRKSIHTYNTVVAYISLIFSVINYFFFKTYDKSIDTFIFAISKEDPLAVIKTVINDYPVFSGLLALAVFYLVFLFCIKRLNAAIDKRLWVPQTKAGIGAYSFIIVLVTFALIRGSFGTFPLRQLNAQVTEKPGVNYCLPSGVLAFYWAYEWEQRSIKVQPVFPRDIVKTYKDLGIELNAQHIDDLFRPLEGRTEHNEFLEQHRPDIVFNVMESMSTHMLSFDDEEERDLMGALRKHFKSDFVFKRFVSEGDGTSDSLTRLLVSSPDLNLSTSVYAQKNYITNIVKMFNDAGYETIFVTASTASWRNYNNFLRYLGFSRIIERSQVKLNFPDATSGAWGIDDEYLFKETYRVLKEKSDRPKFIMTLSITNHPPFRLPNDVEVKKISLPPHILKRFPYDDTETIFATFRYANDQLGRFIDSVKADAELKDKTFIAATGDHNMRGIGYIDHPDELVFGHEVPLYIYMPEQYVKNTHAVFNPERLGSQKDIITTLISHALSDTTYHSFGCDLLSDPDKCRFNFAYNGFVAVPYGKDYACDILSAPEGIAYKILNPETLIVDRKSSKEDCTKAVSLRLLQDQLYRLQANKFDGQDFSTQSIE